jgi:hypothetical protein
MQSGKQLILEARDCLSGGFLRESHTYASIPYSQSLSLKLAPHAYEQVNQFLLTKLSVIVKTVARR